TDSVPTYVTGPVEHADLDRDGVADVVRVEPDSKGRECKCEAYSGRDGRPLWTQPSKDSDHSLPPAYWVECLHLEAGKHLEKSLPVVVVWGQQSWDGPEESRTSYGGLLDGQTGKVLLAEKSFHGEPRPDLLYRQADGGLALVYRVLPGREGPPGGFL